jgi:hypothetical protein
MAISTPTTAGQVLTSAYVNNNINSGLVYIKEQTIGSGVSSVTVNSAFSADFDNYKIVVSNVTLSAAGNSSFFKFVGSTGTTYFSNGYFMVSTSTTVNGLGFNAVNTGIWIGVTGGTTSWSFDVMSPFLAANKNLVGSSAGSGATAYNNFAGSDTSATSRTGFILEQATTNLTGGIITVFGYRKA